MSEHRTPLRIGWLWKMAWRDSRQSRSRLLLFTLSIVLGIAALVAINSFRANLATDIESESKTLMGADIVVSHNQPLSDSAMLALEKTGAEISKEKAFASMVVFSASGATRLVQVRALEGGFPFFGKMETIPEAAAADFRSDQAALIDQTVALQYNTDAGDSVKIGQVSFHISGKLLSVPGQAGIAATMAPPVIIPMAYLAETDLLRQGSRIFHKEYMRFADGTDLAAVKEQLEPLLEAEGARIETFNERKARVGSAFDNLNQFLNLVGFIALLLGCVGVASSVHLYIREKLALVAVLRCLGLSGTQAFLIYLFQVVVIGFIGSLLGAILGSSVQVFLPMIFESFLPLDVSAAVSGWAVLSGVLTGMAMSILFTLIPLLGIRSATPLRTLNSFLEEKIGTWDWRRLLVFAGIVLFVYGFAFLQTENWLSALIFTGGLIIAFLGLAAVAKALVWMVRKFFPSSWSFLWRQALANLYRPNNQTLILVVAIGLGTALLTTLYTVQDMLLAQMEMSDRDNQPNMIIFDIRQEQKAELLAFTEASNFPVIQQVPVVGMRLEKLKGITGAEVKADTTSEIPNHVFDREYRVTYRDSLISSESDVEGSWPYTGEGVGISLSERQVQNMAIELGDEMVFNVAGALIATKLVHIRKVDWARVQTNFTVVFPSDVLKDAPQFHVVVTRSTSHEASAEFQRGLIARFPNVSVIDLELILETLDEVLDQIFFAIRFIALFSILTGLIVLAGSVTVSKFQRIRESVLLRTIGADRKQILAINAIEYFVLGSLASLAGIGLAWGASWGLAAFSFEIAFTAPVLPLLGIFAFITGLTMSIGLLNTRSILSKPPLEVLRKEV